MHCFHPQRMARVECSDTWQRVPIVFRMSVMEGIPGGEKGGRGGTCWDQTLSLSFVISHSEARLVDRLLWRFIPGDVITGGCGAPCADSSCNPKHRLPLSSNMLCSSSCIDTLFENKMQMLTQMSHCRRWCAPSWRSTTTTSAMTCCSHSSLAKGESPCINAQHPAYLRQ